MRTGRFTASECHKLMGKSLDTDTAQTYIMERVSEFLTGLPCREFSSAATDWGIGHEDQARQRYIWETERRVEECEFMTATWSDRVGATPDGICTDRGIEIKCPYVISNHIRYSLLQNQAEFKAECKEYYWQCQMGMLVTGLDKWDFVTFDPRYPDELQIHILTVEADPADHTLLKERLLEAVARFNEIVKAIKE
jgi:hypothetical protein